MNIRSTLLLLAIALLVAAPRNAKLQAQDEKKDPNTQKEQTKKDQDSDNKKNNKKKGNGKKKKKRSPVSVANHLKRLSNSKIKLSDDQKNKLEPISNEYTRKYTRSRQKYEEAVDEKTRKARAAANEKFHAKGHRGDKLRSAIDNAVELTRIQKAAVEIFRKEKQELDNGLRKVLWAALTVKQRQVVGLPEKLPEESP